jgi:hypothetical protein
MNDDQPRPPDPGAAPPPAGDLGGISKDERTLAMLCHLLSFSFVIVPLGNILGPLVLWLIKKDEMPFVDRHGRAVLNFQITYTIVVLVAVLLVFVGVGICILAALPVVHLITGVIGAVRAQDGRPYTYPMAIPFLGP